MGRRLATGRAFRRERCEELELHGHGESDVRRDQRDDPSLAATGVVCTARSIASCGAWQQGQPRDGSVRHRSPLLGQSHKS